MKGSDRCHADDTYCTLGAQTLRVSNIGPGGLFVCSPEPRLPGQTVVLDIQLPRRTIRVEGVVVWVNPAEQPRTFTVPPGFGVRFNELGATDQLALFDYIRHADTLLREDDRCRHPERAFGS
jgi:hypothetical protein